MTTHKLIEAVAKEHDIPFNLLLGVYRIETTYRKMHHRIAENTLTALGFLFGLMFSRPLKNFTIGRCQVGLANILRLSGDYRYAHVKHIKPTHLSQLRPILRAMTIRGSLCVCAKRLHELYYKDVMLYTSYALVYRKIGYEYNGTVTYGMLLEAFAEP